MNQRKDVLMGICFILSLAISVAHAQSNLNVSVPLGTTATTNKAEVLTIRPRPSSSFVQRTLTPEQQAQFQKQREEFRLQLEQRTKERSDFLASVDTKNMTEEERQNHVKLMAAVERSNKIRAELTQTNLVTSSELTRELHDTGHMLDDLYKLERRFLFEDLARSVGCKGTNIVEFANKAQAIIDNTSSTRTSSLGGGRSSSTVRTNTPARGR